MKFISALFAVLVLPPEAFVAHSTFFAKSSGGKILTPGNDSKHAESTSALSSAVDLAYVNDAMDITSILNNPDVLLPAAGAAAVAAIGAAVGLSGNKGGDAASNTIEEEVPKIDVSIEYDAPAKLAFNNLAKGGKGDFAKFKQLYESKAVLEVKKKVYEQKVAREMARMDTEIADVQKEIDGMFG